MLSKPERYIRRSYFDKIWNKKNLYHQFHTINVANFLRFCRIQIARKIVLLKLSTIKEAVFIVGTCKRILHGKFVV